VLKVVFLGLSQAIADAGTVQLRAATPRCIEAVVTLRSAPPAVNDHRVIGPVAPPVPSCRGSPRSPPECRPVAEDRAIASRASKGRRSPDETTAAARAVTI
jgi:hypothetical protein